MRFHSILLLVVGLGVASCDDRTGPEPPGTLVVATSTGGNAPDQDGYQLILDGAESLALEPTGTLEVELASGSHVLRLLGLAEHCTVPIGTSREVEISTGNTTRVEFEVTCTATGARITVVTAGIDIDVDGYRVVVDGSAQDVVSSNGSALTRFLPGSRTIGLTGMSPNCTIDGSDTRTATVGDSEIVPIEFSVVCLAASGVVGVVISATGVDVEGEYSVTIDQTKPLSGDQSGPFYWSAVPPGDHEVALQVPNNCSVANSPQSVTVTGGSLVRDTAEATFSVTCETRRGNLRVTTHTTGTIPVDPYYPTRYEVILWVPDFYYGEYPSPLGTVEPNGGLTAAVEPGIYRLEVNDVPSQCIPAASNPVSPFNLSKGESLDFAFTFTCPP